MLTALTALLQRHKRLVLLAATAVLVVAGLLTADLSSKLTNGLEDYDDPSGGNVAAREVIRDVTGIDPQQGYMLLVHADTALAPDATPPAAVTEAIALLKGRGEVRNVIDYASTGNAGLIAEDGTSTVIVGEVGPMSDQAAIDAEKQMQEAIEANPALKGRTELGGATPAHTQLANVTNEDLGISETIATPILLILLFLVFRGLTAALLPMLGGAFAIMLTLLGMRGLTELMNVSSGGLNLAFALGLGLSIDFSLLIVSRFREELAQGHSTTDALRRTVNTAGRTVAFSSLTVAAALATLAIFPQSYLRSMGLAGVMTVVSAAVFALLVLPALLAALGSRVNSLAPKSWQRGAERPAEQGRWYRVATSVMRRGGLFTALSVLILLVLASPLLGVKFAGVDPSDMPGDVSSGKVAHALEADFANSPTGPLQIVVEAPADAAPSLTAYSAEVAKVPGVQGVSTPRPLGPDHWQIDAAVNNPEGDAGETTVRAVQALPTPHPTQYTGQTADLLAQRDAISDTLPIAAITLVALTLLLLFVFTGSVIVPLMALLLNALSVGAAFGILVWAFQDGNLAGFLHFTDVRALEQTSPILLFALAFGLSTDYNLFLLGRVKEARDNGVGDREAVALGIERTGRMVTSAAVLFCIAVGALMFSRITLIAELGFGTTLAVLIDATIVRAMLVPSLMGLLGKFAWWSPKPLRALHSKLGFDKLEKHDEPAVVPDSDVKPEAEADKKLAGV